MSDRRPLVARVRQLTEGSPYAVTETPAGFDMGLALADARFHDLFGRSRLHKTFVFHVACDDAAGTFSITDDEREVRWHDGVPYLGGPFAGAGLSYSRQIGTIHTKEFHQEFTLGAGGFEKVADYTLDSDQGRAVLRRAGQECGWQERRSAASSVGRVVAIAAGAFAVVVVLVVLVALLLAH